MGYILNEAPNKQMGPLEVKQMQLHFMYEGVCVHYLLRNYEICTITIVEYIRVKT